MELTEKLITAPRVSRELFVRAAAGLLIDRQGTTVIIADTIDLENAIAIASQGGLVVLTRDGKDFSYMDGKTEVKL
jgi:hypothetical protein